MLLVLFIMLQSFLMFLYFSLGMLANAFFIVMFGYAVITLLFYRVSWFCNEYSLIEKLVFRE